MPKKKYADTPEAQSKRFREAVRELVENGELDPTEADAEFERLLRSVRAKPGAAQS